MFKERTLIFIESMCAGTELDTFKPIILFRGLEDGNVPPTHPFKPGKKLSLKKVNVLKVTWLKDGTWILTQASKILKSLPHSLDAFFFFCKK